MQKSTFHELLSLTTGPPGEWPGLCMCPYLGGSSGHIVVSECATRGDGEQLIAGTTFPLSMESYSGIDMLVSLARLYGVWTEFFNNIDMCLFYLGLKI